MRSSFRGIEVLVSVGIAVYLLVFIIPSQVQTGFMKNSQSVPAPAVPAPAVPALAVSALAVSAPAVPLQLAVAGAIQVKASGEEPLSLTDQSPLSAVRSTLNELERRYDVSSRDAFNGAGSSYRFSVPEGLRAMVDFWTAIFGKYGKNQFVFYNKEDVSIVYSVLDLSGFDPNPDDDASDSMTEGTRNQKLAAEKNRIQSLLGVLAGKLAHGEPLLPDEMKFAETFSRENHLSLDEARLDSNIGIQEGLSHRFRRSIALSGQYMAEMERIFTAKGLPVELTRLPFVESAFNVKAISSAGARGLWQFIDPTGERYLKIDSYVDERLDPVLSTFAAAEHLKDNYRQLNSWPLTVNAYNTGLGRMLKAKEALHTHDIVRIIKRFDDPGYQYYSRNYYPEFLAAIAVYDNQDRYFGRINKMAPVAYDLFIIPQDLNLKELAGRLGIEDAVMKKLNPALAHDVLEGKRLLPTGYLVKVPQHTGHLFDLASLETTHDEEGRWYLVKEGETLESISESVGISTESLMETNHLLSGDAIKAGTVLILPLTSADNQVVMGQ